MRQKTRKLTYPSPTKQATWDSQRDAGLFDATLYPSFAGAGPVACVDGVAAVIPGDANNTFRCDNVSFFLPLSFATDSYKC